MNVATSTVQRGRTLQQTYAGGREDLPLGGYVVLMSVYGVAMGAFLGVAASKLPERIGVGDVALLGVATHKLSRIVAKDWVTSPLRAPFVRFEESAGAGEVKETSRGTGLRRAVGDLVSCPWCMGPWVALGLTTAFVASPRVGRAIASLFSIVAVSDWLQHAYVAVKRLSK